MIIKYSFSGINREAASKVVQFLTMDDIEMVNPTGKKTKDATIQALYQHNKSSMKKGSVENLFWLHY